MKSKKHILIIILLLILLGLAGAYIVLGPLGYKTTERSAAFFVVVLELQSTLSYYVGSSYSDSFGVYSKEELLAGKTIDGEKIKDNQDNLLPTLIEEGSELPYKDEEKAYKLNMEHVETTLSIKIDDYEGVNFYVVQGDIIKVKLDATPDWWNNNYNGLLLP